MKRRTFILTTLAAAAAIACPVTHTNVNSNATKDPLSWPEDLGKLADKSTIREIGFHYKKLIPSMYKQTTLRRLLLSDSNGTQVALTDDSAMKEWLKKRISHDFMTFNIITVNGWVISSTEFKQCALFSFLYTASEVK